MCASAFANDGTRSVLVGNTPTPASAQSTSTQPAVVCNDCNACDDVCKKRERVFSRTRTHSENVSCVNCRQVKDETTTVETYRKRLNGDIIKRTRTNSSSSVR